MDVICELARSGGSNGNVADGGTSKSSYYVWFLGSREAKGLRGAEYIRPAVRHLLEYKTDLCRKMTLQVRFVLNRIRLREPRTPAFLSKWTQSFPYTSSLDGN